MCQSVADSHFAPACARLFVLFCLHSFVHLVLCADDFEFDDELNEELAAGMARAGGECNEGRCEQRRSKRHAGSATTTADGIDRGVLSVLSLSAMRWLQAACRKPQPWCVRSRAMRQMIMSGTG